MSEKIDEKMKKLHKEKMKLEIKERLLLEQAKQTSTKEFKNIGELAHKAGIDHLDQTALLGAFIEIFKNSKKPHQIEEWKNSAAEYSVTPENGRKRLVITFEEEPTPECKQKLKEQKFKWNSFRKEFQGLGEKEEVETLLKGNNYHLELVE